ncbi:MAG: prolyl oligopeptidase family serine peptidase, partial [Chloroflexota bacterium]|nr:prolyl oligopeptidase family serine peptidase [Chloroflexota bacterium]
MNDRNPDPAADAPSPDLLPPADDLAAGVNGGGDPAGSMLPDFETPDVVEPQPEFGRPVLSPDGTTIALVLPDATGMRRIVLCPVDGGDPSPLEVQLDLGGLENAPAWSPDGAQLAIAAPHPADGRSAIWVISIPTRIARVLVEHEAHDTEPVWSPDGEWIAFLSRRFGRNAASVVRSDGLTPPIQVSDAAPGFDDHSLTWARDSSRIAFARYAVEGDKQGDHIYTVDVRTGAEKKVTTRLVGRHSLSWAPDRNLIIHVADDNEWDQIAVVNADNSSGWNVAAEKGDKYDPRWSADGQRVTYLRRHEGVVRCCERGTSTATAETIDPGNGVCSGAQFLPDKRVLYVYQSSTTGPQVIVQEPKADAERTVLSILPAWSAPAGAVEPTYVSLAIDDITTGALVYRPAGAEGELPAVIVLRDDPDQARVAEFNLLEQALVAQGLAVYVPTLAGTPGEGRKLHNLLATTIDTEPEMAGLLALVASVGAQDGVDSARIGLVGVGYGGALALVLAGQYEAAVQAVAAVDPICDWHAEFDAASASMRDWIVSNIGLPATNQGRFAVRTPATWAGIIAAPLLLMGTESARTGRAAQLDGLTAVLRDLDR